MPLRIGFDMDGVLADFSQAFREVESRLFGRGEGPSADEPAREEEVQETKARPSEDASLRNVAGGGPAANGAGDSGSENIPEPLELEDTRAAKNAGGEGRRRRDLIWRDIQSTPNFWSTLKPTDENAVRRIHEMTLRHQWEVFFITQRPKTNGETVQRQTQLWLVEQGFDLPSVLVLAGSRGAAAGALRLDYHVDDSAQNCLDVIADSKARPILIVPDNDALSVLGARKLGIATARSIGECLDILEEVAKVHTQPTLLQRLAALVGWS
jgi:phosphoglycolate phosphatase-like HAD superfamily hydrolase